MALIESTGPALGTPAPDFSLPATHGATVALEDFDADTLVVMFICNHCPYVKATIDRLNDLAREHDAVDFVAICSNDPVRYPADNFDAMKEFAHERDFEFSYLQDESQQVARAYGAVCTPDIFVYDRDRELAYRGRIDDNWKNADAVTSRDLHQALVALERGESPDEDQKPSMGCSIKWKE